MYLFSVMGYTEAIVSFWMMDPFIKVCVAFSNSVMTSEQNMKKPSLFELAGNTLQYI